jgi:chromosomal replication initiation ATPase DnaA
MVDDQYIGGPFSLQISMYLAKHVGGWSTHRIGRFYNGRHRSTIDRRTNP